MFYCVSWHCSVRLLYNSHLYSHSALKACFLCYNTRQNYHFIFASEIFCSQDSYKMSSYYKTKRLRQVKVLISRNLRTLQVTVMDEVQNIISASDSYAAINEFQHICHMSTYSVVAATSQWSCRSVMYPSRKRWGGTLVLWRSRVCHFSGLIHNTSWPSPPGHAHTHTHTLSTTTVQRQCEGCSQEFIFGDSDTETSLWQDTSYCYSYFIVLRWQQTQWSHRRK